MTGTLYIVGTPIGNSKDITLRALETFNNVTYVIAEDTRVTSKLFSLHNIQTPLRSFHHHSSTSVMEKIYEDIKNEKNIALVTDAGMPGISDPGGKLIEYIIKKDTTIAIETVPGPSALTAALSLSGFPTDRFTFYGFLPHKKGKQKILKEISDSKYTSVFFESPHRVKKTLHDLTAITLPTETMSPYTKPSVNRNSRMSISARSSIVSVIIRLSLERGHPLSL